MKSLSRHSTLTAPVLAADALLGRPRQGLRPWLAALLSLTALGHATAQDHLFVPGILDRVQVVITSFGGSVSKTTPNTLATGVSLEISDSTFPLTGESIKLQFQNQPPVQPILDGTLRFNFPAVIPAGDVSGVFQPSMSGSVSFEGTWTKGNFNYPMGEAVSYSATHVLLGWIQPTGCPNPTNPASEPARRFRWVSMRSLSPRPVT